MSLLLDALKKAADDKKASQAEAGNGTAPAVSDQGQAVSAERESLENAPRDTLAERPQDTPDQRDELSLEAIDEPPAGTAEFSEQGTDGAATGIELTLDEEPVEQASGNSAQPAEDSEPETETAPTIEPPLNVAPAIEDRGRDRTISDEALSMLIYNTNRDIRKTRIAAVTSLVIISLLVLLSGGFYFYTDMQAEIASLERQHRNAMLAMQAKTSSEKAPKQSEIIRNLVSDKDLDEKVQFAREHQQGAAPAPAQPSRQATANKATTVDRGDEAGTRQAEAAGPASGQPVMSIQRSRSVDPLEAKLEQAWYAYDTGNYQASRQLYDQVLAVEADNRDALLGIGAIAVIEGDQPAAIDAYVRLLEIDPTDPIAGAAISDLRITDTNADEVERYLGNMLQKNPQSSPLNFAIGNFYARRQQWHDAQKHYFNAWQNDSGNADYLFNLAVSMDQLDKPEQALAFYRDSLNKAGDRQVRFSREAVRKRIAALSEI